jgi:hypothetical protein
LLAVVVNLVGNQQGLHLAGLSGQFKQLRILDFKFFE